MRFGFIRLLAAAALATQATSALAFFDVQALVGRRWYELKGDYDQNVSSQEMVIAAHIDPIPLVPVAFGASVAMGALDKDAYANEVKTASVFEGSLEVMAWIPMVPIITPYARLKYPVVSKVLVESETTIGTTTTKTAATSTLSGPTIGVGAKWAPLPVLKFLVEAQRGMQKIEADEFKINDLKVSSDAKGDAPSNAFLVGVEIGL